MLTSLYEHCILMNCVLIVLTLDHTVYCYLVALFWLLFLFAFSSQPKKISLDIYCHWLNCLLCLYAGWNTLISSPLLNHLSILRMTFPLYIICWMLNIWENDYFNFCNLYSLYRGCLTCPHLVWQLGCFSNELNHGVGLLLIMVPSSNNWIEVKSASGSFQLAHCHLFQGVAGL